MTHTDLDPIQLHEARQRAHAFISLPLAQREAGGDPDVLLRAFERRAGTAYSHLVRAATGVGTLDVWDTALRPLREAFVGLVDRASVVGALIRAGALSVPLPQAGRFLISEADAAATVAEGAVKPVASLAFSVDTTGPTKVARQVVFSAEVARSADPAMQAGMEAALVSCLAAGVDAEVIGTFLAGSPGSVAGSGATMETVGTVMDAISSGAPARPVIIGSYGDLVPLAGGLADLQAMGVVIVPCAAAAGNLIALDASGLLVADGGAEVSIGRHPQVTMPDGSVCSVWAENLVALKAERWFKVSYRPDAVAFASTVGSS
jgi:hypothetical protein